jgi:hypothetical protein
MFMVPRNKERSLEYYTRRDNLFPAKFPVVSGIMAVRATPDGPELGYFFPPRASVGICVRLVWGCSFAIGRELDLRVVSVGLNWLEVESTLGTIANQCHTNCRLIKKCIPAVPGETLNSGSIVRIKVKVNRQKRAKRKWPTKNRETRKTKKVHTCCNTCTRLRCRQMAEYWNKKVGLKRRISRIGLEKDLT